MPATTKKKPATIKAVRARAAEMSDAFLACRDIGHRWHMYYQKRQAASGRGSATVIHRKFYCPSCKTNRFVVLNKYGEVVSNKYDYAHGYQLKGLGTLQGHAKTALRLESIARTPDFEEYRIYEEPDFDDDLVVKELASQ